VVAPAGRVAVAIAAAIALIAGCSGSDRDAVVTVTASAASGTSSPAAIELRFRPVLQIMPPTDMQTTRPENDRADQPVVLPELDSSGSVVSRFYLGPAFLDRSGIDHAEAVYQNGWQVTIALKDSADGIDTWNKACEECFNGAASCPGIGSSGRGLVAIVLDSVVMSAPEIQPDNAEFKPFQADQISISGSFTEAEAKALADGLSQT
jgi:preprotein translocase subunit SecD